MISRADLQDLYPLTSLQEGMLFHRAEASAPSGTDTIAYQVQVQLQLAGPLDAAAFRRAWEELAARHPVLRTRFIVDRAERPLQAVLRQTPLDWRWRDLSHLPPAARAGALDGLRRHDRNEPLDPTHAPPWRLTVARAGDAEHELLWTFHHLLLDGWSASSLLAEALAAYQALAAGRRHTAPPRRPFSEYVAWLERRDRRQAVAFWRELLAGYDAAPALPRRAHGAGDAAPDEAVIELAAGSTARLVQLAATHQTTLANLLGTMWAVLLGSHGGRRDVVFGTVVAIRPPELPGAETMAGLLVNTVPVRVRWRRGEGLAELLARAREQAIRRQPFLHAPLGEVQPGRGVVDHLLAFESYPIDERLLPQAAGGSPGPADLRLTGTRVVDPTHYDLEVVIDPAATLRVKLRFRPAVYEPELIRGLAARFGGLLRTLGEEPHGALEELVAPTPAERRRILERWSGGGVAATSTPSFLDLFAEQVAAHPDAIALAWEGGAVSYRRLATAADRLARRLRSAGVEPEVVVGLGLGRGVELVTGVLAVLRAGGAFLAIDPSYPPARRELMLRDAGLRILLTARPWAERFAGFDGSLLLLDEPLPAAAPATPPAAAQAAWLAYLVYTSGSTGRPKGAELHHRGMANLASALIGMLDLGPGCRMLQLSSPSFDASVWEMVAALGSGATLVLADGEALQPGPPLFATLAAQRVTDAIIPPSTLAALPRGELPELRRLVAGGEACPAELVDAWAPGRSFWNAYGPTEASVCATVSGCRAAAGAPAIGRPLPGVHVHLLDDRMQLVAAGAAGEIFVGGAGVGRGYRGRPGATAERFVPDPWGGAGGRLYRTGDLGRWRADGEIVFGGRSDEQVKVRGFRIELGEVEAALAGMPGVALAAAAVRGEGVDERTLIACVVAAAGARLDAAQLSAALRQRLPAPLVPSQLSVVAELPRLPGGKIDRRAVALLPPAAARDPSRPRTAVEEAVAATWAAVLGRERVGPDEDFFALGGHSLLATQVVSRLRQLFAVEVGVRDLFAAGTAGALAARIEELRHGPATALPPLAAATGDEGRQPTLSFGQERIWVLEQLRPGTAAYNMPASARVSGPLSPAALEQALGEVVRRHQVLRTRFTGRDGQPRATVVEDHGVPLAVVDLEALAPATRPAVARRLAAAEAARAFDLARGPLLRATLILGGAAGVDVLLWTLHHIAADGWSMSLLGREVGDLYEAFTTGTPSPLPELTVQYGDFARWQRRWLQGDTLDRQLAYWRHDLAGAPPVIALPLDRPRSAARGGRGAAHGFRLEPELARSLAALARRRAATLHMTLLAGYAALLHRLGADTDVVIGTLAANRRAAAVEPLIGFFVNTLPLRLQLAGDPSYGELVDRVRATALAAYDHEDAPFERIVEALAPARSPAHLPLVQTILVMQNAPRAELALAGVQIGDTPLVAASAVRFDLELYLWEERGGLEGVLLYQRDLFAAATAARLTRQLATLLRAAVAAPARPISRLPLLDEAERERLLAPRPSPPSASAGRSLIDLLAESARRHRDRLAVVCGDEAMTYGGLERLVTRLAHRLREAGAGRGDLVGIAADRSPAALAAMLAALRAGCAYVPIDPGDPPARVALLVEDCGMRALAGSRRTLATGPAGPADPFGGFAGPRLAVEDATGPGSCPAARGAFPRPLPAELAYVVYTSGSTGRPKGVAVTHEGLSNYLAWAAGAYAAEGPVDCAFFTSPSFDLTVTSLFLPLITGGKVVIHPRRGAADAALLEVVREDGVDVLKLTPAHLALLAAELREGAGATPRPSRVRRLIVGGEQLSTELARQARRIFGEHVVVQNEYGPTETVVGCTVHTFDAARDRGEAVPIGAAIGGCRVLVLDRRLLAAAPGAVGEVYVAGPGVARGYLRRPGLTAERFLPLPFAGGERMYRTADLATWDETGCLQFRGRADREVKVRGFRVDLREIEAVLRAQPGVGDCVVVQRRPAAAGAPAGGEDSCVRCGLPASHPHARLGGDGVCQVCRDFDGYRERARSYFRPLADLQAIFAAQRAARPERGDPPSGSCPPHDCLMLYSGGKDSTYALYQLVREMGLQALVFTLDNGFLSRQAMANIERVVAALGVEHVVATIPQMNQIFVDSLERHSNVCNGCFKTIYTAALDLARRRGIRWVVTGLSRGQMFETRLAELFRAGVFDPDEAERLIVESRKSYHREADAVGRLLAGDLFADDRIFDEVRFLDFYRYCDVELAEMVRYLDAHAPWVRPSDTGRSTNCLINDLGIALHRRQRGFHNYALPYSWDVRLGHKTRREAAAELADTIDPAKVRELLISIGHPDPDAAEPGGEARLVAYLVGAAVDGDAVRAAAAERLPAHMVPAAIVRLDSLPLTPHGKVDLAALPEPGAAARRGGGTYVAPRNADEARMAAIWANVLAVERVGVDDDFFALGGHSLLATQIMARLRDAFGVELPMHSIVEHPTVGDLAALVAAAGPARGSMGALP